jgi:O-antigen/teichoic acid export membrane protein
MALILSGLAGPLLQFLYGSEYVSAAPIFVVLAWSAAANWLYAPLGTALQARGEERRWLACLVCVLLLNAAANFLAIPRWGALGAAGATLASEVVLLVLAAILAGKTLGILPPLRPVLVGLGATVGGGMVLWALHGQGSWSGTVAALFVYTGVLVLFKTVTAEDAAMVIGWVRQLVPGLSRG